MPLKAEFQRTSISSLLGQRLVFFGNEKLATGIESKAPLLTSLVEYGHEIEAIILRGKQDKKKPLAVEQVALEHNIEVYWVQTKADLNSVVNNLNSEIAVLASFGMIVPKEVLDAFKFGIINVHPSLLPHYRGSSPIEQAIIDGLDETGVSLMQLSEKMDEGPIFIQETVPIPQSCSKQDLYELLVSQASPLLPESIVDIISGKLSSSPQIGTATYTPLIKKQDGLIDFELPAEEIERRVRAYADWPKAQAAIKSMEILLHKTRVNDDHQLQPGEIKIIDKKILLVGTKTSSLEITELQPVGKKIISAQAFINGYLK